ncbi:MAG: FG-GAP repeat protein [Deltaproteobacteria bacterium]|nr:FG-GAP repeat protein [Deltaproteobacteria bacterium]
MASTKPDGSGGQTASFSASNCGPSVTLGAPGIAVPLLWNYRIPRADGIEWVTYAGTSFAAPHVAAEAGLLWSRQVTDPALALTADDIVSLMRAEATDLAGVWHDGYPGLLATGWDSMSGFGALDLEAAVSRVGGSVHPAPVIRAEIRMSSGLPWTGMDDWRVPPGSPAFTVEAVAGDVTDSGVWAQLAVAPGAEPDFDPCPSASCTDLAAGSPTVEGRFVGVLTPDLLPEGRSTLRLHVRDGGTPSRWYEDRVGIVVDNLHVVWPARSTALPRGGRVTVRGSAATAAPTSRVGVSIRGPGDPGFREVYVGTAPTTDVIGWFDASPPTVTSVGAHTIRVTLEAVGVTRTEDVPVYFEDASVIAPPWPVRVEGGVAADNWVTLRASPPLPGTLVAALRQLHPYEDAGDAEPSLLGRSGEVESVVPSGAYDGPVCAGEFDGTPGQEIVVTEEVDRGGALDTVLRVLDPSAGSVLEKTFLGEPVTNLGMLYVRPNIVIDDMDGDGEQDVCVLTRVAIHVVNRSGVEPYRPLPMDPSDHGSGLVGAFDFDGDGRKELVTYRRKWLPGDYWWSEIAVYELDETTHFIQKRGQAWPHSDWPAGLGIRDAALRDVDGDGIPEIVWVGVDDPQTWDFAHGHFDPPTTYVGVHQVTILADRSASVTPLPGFSVFRASHYSSLVPVEWQYPDTAARQEAAARVGLSAADLDGDGRAEILLSGGRTIHALGANGLPVAGWISPDETDPAGNPVSYGRAAVGDVDGNGTLDIVADRISHTMLEGCSAPTDDGCCPNLEGADAPPSAIVALQQDGSLIWEDRIGGVALGGTPAFSDVDGDGLAEVVVSAALPGNMTVLGFDRGYPIAGGVFVARNLPTAWTPGHFPWSGYRGSANCNGAPGPTPVRIVELALHEEDSVIYGADEADVLGLGFPSQRAMGLASGNVVGGPGDGIDDIIIGAPGGDAPDGTENVGEVHVMQGRSALPASWDLRSTPSTVVLYGSGSGNHFGYATATGDVDGDGDADLVVGAPFTPSDGSRVGAVHVFLGPLAPGPRALDVDPADATILGPVEAGLLGMRLLVADLDGDNHADIVVEAPAAEPYGTRECAATAFVIDGSYVASEIAAARPVIDLSTDPPGAVRSTIYTPVDRGIWCDVEALIEPQGARNPYSAGDMDGDTVLDLVLGSPALALTAGRSGSGVVDVFYGASLPAVIDLRTARGNISIEGAGNSHGLGFQVATGDVNGDTVADLVAGAPGGGRAGEVAVIYGRDAVVVRRIDLAAPPGGETLRILASDDLLGSGISVATADIDGDTLADVVAGTPAPPAGAFNGAAWVVRAAGLSSGVRDLSVDPPDLLVLGAGPDDRAAWALSDGDITGDGRGDLVVAVPGGDGPEDDRPWAGEVAIILGWDPAAP